MTTDRLWLRGAGLVILLGCLATYDANGTSLAHRLLIPMLLALGAWALVWNLSAVALGGTVLAVIHADFSGDWVSAAAYPVLAATGMTILTVTYLGRFRQRIRETRAERWADRDAR